MADKLPPILIENGEPIPGEKLKNHYPATEFKSNVRIDLSDKEIRVPKKRFKEVRQRPRREVHIEIIEEDVLRAFFTISAILGVISMFVYMFSGIHWIKVVILVLCYISFVLSLITNKLKFSTWAWAFNSVLWSFQVFEL